MSEGQKPMPDSKVKELSDMPWKQREESRTWQKERVIQELRSQGKRMTKQRMILLDVILSGKWNCCKEIYYPELTSHRVAEIISEETGAEPLLLHSCHNVTRREFDSGVTYLDLMEQNVINLKKGLE